MMSSKPSLMAGVHDGVGVGVGVGPGRELEFADACGPVETAGRHIVFVGMPESAVATRDRTSGSCGRPSGTLCADLAASAINLYPFHLSRVPGGSVARRNA